MTLTINDNWLEAFRKDRISLRYIVSIRVGVKVFLTVLDFSQGSGRTVTVVLNGDTHVLDEGIEFTAETDNTTTARNIAKAINDSTILSGLAASSEGAVVTVVAGDAEDDTLTIFSGAAAAWDTIPAAFTEGQFDFVSGGSNLFGFPNSVKSVSPTASEINIRSRAMTVSSVTILMADDQAVREIIKSHSLVGKKVVVSLGTPELVESDFIKIAGSLKIDNVSPPQNTLIRISCSNAYGWIRDTKVLRYQVSQHPLAIAKDYFIQAGAPSDITDDSSFDETLLTDISHFNVSRFPVDEFEDVPTGLVDAKRFIDSLMILVDGTIFQDENGDFKFKRFDQSGLSVRSFTMDDIFDFRQESMDQEIINRVAAKGPRVSSRRDVLANLGFPGTVIIDGKENDIELSRGEDTNSQALFAFPGEDQRIIPDTIANEWFANVFHILDGKGGSTELGSTPTPTEIIIPKPDVLGFTGARLWDGSERPAAGFATQRAEDKISASRPAFFLITDGVFVEVIRSDSLIMVGGVGTQLSQRSVENTLGSAQSGFDPTSPTSFPIFSENGIYAISKRDVDGTGQIAWNTRIQTLGFEVRVYDVTMARFVVDNLIKRFGVGVSIISFATQLSEMKTQVGDIVNVTHPKFMRPGKDGSDANTFFEIIRKEPRPFGDTPGIHWKAAWLRDDVITIPIVTQVQPNVDPILVEESMGYIFDDGTPVVNSSFIQYQTGP